MQKKVSLLSLVACILLLYFSSCSNFKDMVYINELTQENVSKNRLERITNRWVGHFSNKNDKNKTSEQEIIGRRIWKKSRVDEYWIYLGWFQTNSYESALSSSLAQITRIAPDTAYITFYQIKEETKIDPFEWKKDEPFEQLKRSDLEACRTSCGSFVVERSDGSCEVVANGPCYSPISNQIKYYKIDATLTASNILFHTKFLDKHFNVLIAYKNNVFSRFTRSELKKKYENFALID